MTSTRLLYRFATVVALVLLLLVPLQLIGNIIMERTLFRAEAVHRVVKNTSGEQRFLGPLLVVPWTDKQEVWVPNAQNQSTRQLRVTTGALLRTPAKLTLGGKLLPNQVHVGLYDVSVYEWQGSLQASFDGGLPTPSSEITRSYGEPYLVFGISDVRGLVGTPALQVDGAPIKLASGTGTINVGGGVHARLPAPVEHRLDGFGVELTFALKGTYALQIVPVGGDNQVDLTSSWPHPKFDGSSPRSTVSAAGFQAHWDISGLASNVQSRFGTGPDRWTEVGASEGAFSVDGDVDAVSVSLVNPVDVYTQTERASKYGILFIVLTFVGFVLFELVRRLSIHPLQYLLVGLALAIFFLLLLSLSEHLEFWLAYTLAAAGCIGLQFVYLSGVLKRWSRAAGFAALLTSLYGVLYVLLASEDNALLMGSLLLFAVLATVMAITRRIDWYQLGANLPTARVNVPQPAPGSAGTGAGEPTGSPG